MEWSGIYPLGGTIFVDNPAPSCPSDVQDIVIGHDANANWHFDDDPDSSDEYDSDGLAFPFDDIIDEHDFRTVVEHELCHALGFSIYFYQFDDCVDTESFEWTCTPPDALIDSEDQLRSHLDRDFPQDRDLMHAELQKTGIRRNISWRDVQMLESAYGEDYETGMDCDCGYENLLSQCQDPEKDCDEINSGCTGEPECVDGECRYPYDGTTCDDDDVCTFDRCCSND